MHPTSIVWLRNDLRLDDHVPLRRALDAGGDVVLATCTDPRRFAPTPLGVPRTGPHRARFQLETIADLRRRARERGGDLVVRHERPEVVLPELARRVGARDVFAHGEVCSEERAVELAVRRGLRAVDAALHLEPGHSMLHLDDLPFAIDELPDVFTAFRRIVERECSVREPVPAPARLPALAAGLDAGTIPSLADLGVVERPLDARAVLAFRGGETAALERLDHYLWRSDHVAHYRQTRDALLGADTSTKFSPWLAIGALSPRRVHTEIRRYETERVRNDSTYWVVFELLWRDFFRFVAEKHGDALFRRSGFSPDAPAPTRREDPHERDRLRAWIEGRTGEPFVDANMRELAATGFLSNRGRQIVASFLIHELDVEWRWGARWFEHALIDDDVHSNWGNWAYIAGVGNDPRRGRHFDVRAQARRHDPRGEYVARWTRPRVLPTLPTPLRENSRS